MRALFGTALLVLNFYFATIVLIAFILIFCEHIYYDAGDSPRDHFAKEDKDNQKKYKNTGSQECTAHPRTEQFRKLFHQSKTQKKKNCQANKQRDKGHHNVAQKH